MSNHHNERRFGMRPLEAAPQPHHLHGAGSFSDCTSHHNGGHSCFAMPQRPYPHTEAADYNGIRYNNTGFQYTPNYNLSLPGNPQEIMGARPPSYTEEGAVSQLEYHRPDYHFFLGSHRPYFALLYQDEDDESMDRKLPPIKPGGAPSFPLQESTHRTTRKPPPVAAAPNSTRRSLRQTTKKATPRKETKSPAKRRQSTPPSRQSPRKARKVAPADRASGGPAVRSTRTQDPRPAQEPLVEQRMEPSEENECKTNRARRALKNWYERLNDLHKFRAIHGHGKNRT
jgi:hypothetical protein